MKLQTMLLPTGEFVLIGSEARPASSAATLDMRRDALTKLKNATGAAAFFATDEAVEIVDALVHPDAVRAAPPAAVEPETPDEPILSDESHVTTNVYLPYVEFDPPETEIDADGTINLSGRAISSGWIDIGKMSTEYASALFGQDFRPTEGNLTLTRQIADGADFTPAGLVKGKPGDPDFLRDPQFARGGEPGADPEPEVVHAGQDWDIDPPWEPKVGDLVEIVMVNGWEDSDSVNPYTGRRGRIIDNYGHPERGLWDVTLTDGDLTFGSRVIASRVKLVVTEALQKELWPDG